MQPEFFNNCTRNSGDADNYSAKNSIAQYDIMYLHNLIDMAYQLGRQETQNFENPIDTVSMSEGENDMAKRMRHKIDINGKSQWIQGTTQQELCEDYLQKSIASGAVSAQIPIEQKKESVDFVEYFWKWFNLFHVEKVTSGTSRTTKSLINAHIAPYFKGTNIADITTNDLQDFFNSNKELSKSTCHSMYTYLKKVFKRAIKDGLIEKNPLDDDEISYSQKKKKRKSLEEDQAADVEMHLDTIKGIDRLIIAIPLYLGIRRGEFLGLRWEDFDFEKKLVRIERAIRYSGKTGNQPIISPTKNGLTRWLSIVPELEKILQPFIKESGFVFECDTSKPTYADDYEGTRFDDSSKPITEKMYKNDMARIKKQIDLHGATAHVFRHTYATTAAGEGIDPKSLQGLLGHKRIDMTMNVYAEVREKKVAAAGMALSGMYGRAALN